MVDAASLQEPGTDSILILASASQSRAAMLRAAGLSFRQIPADLDEALIRRRYQALTPLEIAVRLACCKAEAVGEANPGNYVIAADQVLQVGDKIFDKPGSRQKAYEQLMVMSGGTHALHSAVCVALNGKVLWHHVDTAHVTFRDYSPDFIERYLDAAGEDILHCVGACQIEALGVHLFSAVKGDYFTILGMPLLPLIGHLRREGIIAA